MPATEDFGLEVRLQTYIWDVIGPNLGQDVGYLYLGLP
jgi:hypothetical protein